MAEFKIFNQQDAAILEQTGKISPVQERKRTVSIRSLHSSSEESEPLSTPSHPSLTIAPALPNGLIEIPEDLYSLETFIFLGFQEHVAREMWERWTANQDLEFMSLPRAHVNNADMDAIAESDNWALCLDQLGIKTELSDAILDPAFRDVRLTASAKFWVKDTLMMRFASLEEINESSNRREAERARIVATTGQSNTLATGQDTSVTGPSNTLATGPTVSTEAMHPSAVAPGCTVLWKGLDRKRVEGLLNSAGQIRNLLPIASNPPGDFSGERLAYYFTIDKDIALCYARYARRRSSASTVVLLKLDVLNSLIETMNPLILRFPERNWKEVVWTSRRRDRLPRHLKHINSQPLLIGHIAKTYTTAISRLEFFEMIDEHSLLRLEDGTPGTQYVFSSDAAEVLEENCREALSIHPI